MKKPRHRTVPCPTVTSILATVSPFTYRGYCYDYDIGMYYLQSRYYDPQICRFINADSTDYLGATGTVLSYNLFAYCENEPVDFVDETGFFKKKYHYDVSYQIARKVFNSHFSKKIAEGAKEIDDIYNPVLYFYSSYCQSFHFNTNIGTNKQDSRLIRSNELLNKAISYLKKAANVKKQKLLCRNYLDKAFQYFGRALHPIQDTIAHSGSKGQKTGYIYRNVYSGESFMSYKKLKHSKFYIETGVFYHHLQNGKYDADDPNGLYLNTGRTKDFYAKTNTTTMILFWVGLVKSYGFYY